LTDGGVGWVGVEIVFIFSLRSLVGLTCGALSISAKEFIFATSELIYGSHLSDFVSIHVQPPISVNYKKLPEKSWFFAIET
jgi:hypothetical protein